MDKRIGKTIARAHDAALRVLGSKGFGSFNMDAVAEESGIAKSTLYRHWPDRMELLADALQALNIQPHPAEPLKKGELRDRVILLLTHLVSVFRDSQISEVIPGLIEAARHHPKVAGFLHAYSAARRATLVDALRQGAQLGELPAHVDPELASLMLSGPVFYCRLMTPTPFPHKNIEALVDLVLDPGRARAARSRPKSFRG